MVEVVFMSVGLTLALSILVIDFILKKSNINEIVRKRIAMIFILLTLTDFVLFLSYVFASYFFTQGLTD